MNVLLADDDSNVRSALRLLLENECGIAIVGDCAAADELVERVSSTGAAVVVLDWDMPGLHPAVLSQLKARHPVCQLLALSVRPEQRLEALAAGVVTFVCKGDAPETLMRALHGLRAGRAGTVEPRDEAESPAAQSGG